MRIIGGLKRGLKLISPTEGQTRPTMDRTREDIMNILQSGKFRGRLNGACVADVFAGSGSVGLEMVSRGAVSCTFYESHNNALKALNTNIKKFGIGRITVEKDALRPKTGTPYDIVFMDAPYNLNLTEKAFQTFLNASIISNDTLVIIQVAKDEPIPEITPFTIIDERKMGGGKVAFLTVTS